MGAKHGKWVPIGSWCRSEWNYDRLSKQATQLLSHSKLLIYNNKYRNKQHNSIGNILQSLSDFIRVMENCRAFLNTARVFSTAITRAYRHHASVSLSKLV